MPIESREFIRLRNDLYAAAASEVQPEEKKQEGDEPLWRCMGCNLMKPIPAFQHMCAECVEEVA